MSLKSAYAPSLKRNVKFGRKKPKFPSPKLKASSFLNLSQISVPASTNYRANASASLRNIYGNDTLGDCVPAGCNHTDGEENANAGSSFVPTLANVIADYSAIGGYVPGNEATDNGCDEDTRCTDYQSWYHVRRTPSKRLPAVISVDATNDAEVRACFYLFENLIFGVGLPDKWISPMPSADGFVCGYYR